MISEVKAIDIAKAVDGIDLIVDGHSHSILADYSEFNKNNETKITSTGEYLKNLGQVTITFDEESEVKDIEINTADISTLTEESSEINELVNSIKDGQKDILNEVVGYTPILLEEARDKVRWTHTNLGRLITSAMLNETGADIAITNGGGIRDSILAGDIAKNAIIKVLPFGNYIVTKKVKGSDIIAALEHGMVEGTGAFSHFAGMIVESKREIDSKGVVRHKLMSVKINGENLDLNKEYILATNDFMAVGGDGYEMFKDYPTLNEYSTLDESLINFIKVVDAEGILAISDEKRLIVKENGAEELPYDDKNETEGPNEDKNEGIIVTPGDGNSDRVENSNDNKTAGKKENLPNTGGRSVLSIIISAVIMIAGGAILERNKNIIN